MIRTAVALLLLSLSVATVNGTQSGGSTAGSVGARQGPSTPERGSPERKAILEALRVPVEKQLKQSIVFKIDHFKVQGNWAFLTAVPQRPNGSAVNYSGTIYQEAVDAGAFDDGIVALLRNVKGKWRVVEYVIGATDVPYVDWDKEYKAPKGIFNVR